MTIPELVTATARLSPFEDFRARTLSALSGIWEKLLYMTELRSKDGRYQHWGHSKVHGESRSQASLGQAHSELYLESLRAPIRDLVEELEASTGLIDKMNAETSSHDQGRMIPEHLQGGSRNHFNSVVLAARLAYEDRQASNRSVA